MKGSQNTHQTITGLNPILFRKKSDNREKFEKKKSLIRFYFSKEKCRWKIFLHIVHKKTIRFLTITFYLLK